MSLNSFSKTFGMCGFRVGYLYSPDKKLVRDVVEMKVHTSMNTNILGQEMAYEATKVPREYIDNQTKIWKERRDLHRAVSAAEANARKAVEAEDFGAAMTAIAKLRGPVDAFFDKVTVNADDPSFRENRLKLLNRIRAATLAVADFSKIEG